MNENHEGSAASADPKRANRRDVIRKALIAAGAIGAFAPTVYAATPSAALSHGSGPRCEYVVDTIAFTGACTAANCPISVGDHLCSLIDGCQPPCLNPGFTGVTVACTGGGTCTPHFNFLDCDDDCPEGFTTTPSQSVEQSLRLA